MTSQLIVADRIRSTIKRMFSGSHAEVFSELLQNAQRVKATRVDFRIARTDAVTLHYQDNGPGLADADAFFRLLALGASGYDAETEQAQNPMGFGFNSLLAHEDVDAVLVRSRGLSLHIEAARWWQDASYAEGWRERLVPCEDQYGLALSVHYKPTAGRNHSWQTFDAYVEGELRRQAETYFGFFGVTINEVPVAQKLPSSIDPAVCEPVLCVEGQLADGTPIRWLRGKENSFYNLFVRWYGQMMSENLPSRIPNCWTLYLDVTQGQPVDLVAPTRKSVIRNDKFERVLAEAKAVLFHALNARPTLPVAGVRALYDMAPDLFDAHSRFGLLRTGPLSEVRDPEVVTQAEVDKLLAAQKLYKLDSDVHVVSEGLYRTTCCTAEGLDSFLPYAPKGHTLAQSVLLPENWGTVPMLTCFWRKGQPYERQPAYGFKLFEPGEVAWMAEGAEPDDSDFKALPAKAVVHVGESKEDSLDELDVCVGLKGSFEAYLDAHAKNWLSGNADEEATQDACWDLKRRLRGNAVAASFTLASFTPFLADDEFVLACKLGYKKLAEPVDRPEPSHVTVTTSQGRKLKFELYG
jgi:hypothetical protein